MGWIIANWEYCLLGLYVVEKVVKVTPVKWDDIIVDGVKEILFKVVKKGK